MPRKQIGNKEIINTYTAPVYACICDSCGSSVELVEEVVGMGSTPVGWHSFISGNFPKYAYNYTCDKCLQKEKEENNTSEVRLKYSALDDILDLFWDIDVNDFGGHTVPDGSDKIKNIYDTIKEIIESTDERLSAE